MKTSGSLLSNSSDSSVGKLQPKKTLDSEAGEKTRSLEPKKTSDSVLLMHKHALCKSMHYHGNIID